MKPWMILSTLAVVLVSIGVWLVWSQSPDVEAPAEPEEEIAIEEEVPTPAAAPVRDIKPIPPQPEQALDQAEVLRVLEEMAKNQQALEDWDQRLVEACKSLIKGKKYEEAQQCYHLRLARNPEDGKAYLERGILHARMGKRVEAYWDYVKYLELDPDGARAPQIRKLVEKYEEFASGNYTVKPRETDHRQEIFDLAKRLYEEAYVIKRGNPEGALRKLEIVVKLSKWLSEDRQVYREKAERLIERIKSGPE